METGTVASAESAHRFWATVLDKDTNCANPAQVRHYWLINPLKRDKKIGCSTWFFSFVSEMDVAMLILALTRSMPAA